MQLIHLAQSTTTFDTFVDFCRGSYESCIEICFYFFQSARFVHGWTGGLYGWRGRVLEGKVFRARHHRRREIRAFEIGLALACRSLVTAALILAEGLEPR